MDRDLDILLPLMTAIPGGCGAARQQLELHAIPIDGSEFRGAATDDLERELFHILHSEPVTPERPEDFAVAPRRRGKQ